MIAMVGQHTGSVFFSVALHVAIVVALALTFRWPVNMQVASAPAPIQGFAVDPSVLKAEQQRRDQDVQRKQKDERDKREAAEQKQREKEAADKRERDRVAEQQRLKEQADRDKADAAKREQEKAAQEKAAKAAQEKAAQEARDKQAKDDAARKQKDAAAAKEKARLDAETQREAAQEAARMEAERSGAFNDYLLQIQNQIARNWNQPLSAQPGLECVINVVQLPTGDVFKAEVDPRRCNGDEAVRRSIEAAVQKASPLPKPPSQAMYERNLIVTFRPDVQRQ
jgi:colicin import membrane protein